MYKPKRSITCTCDFLKAREKSRVHVAIGFGFASHSLINWREIFQPITKRSNCNRVITFDSHLKTALIRKFDFIKPESHDLEAFNSGSELGFFKVQKFPSLFECNVGCRDGAVVRALASQKCGPGSFLRLGVTRRLKMVPTNSKVVLNMREKQTLTSVIEFLKENWG